MSLPPTEDEARRLVDLYFRPTYPDIFVGEASLNQNWTAYLVEFTSGGTTHTAQVTGYAGSEVVLT